MNDVAQLLTQIERGDPSSAEQLLPLVYEELRQLAAARLAQEQPGLTLQATALVHEAYLRLVGGSVGNALRGVPGVESQESGVGITIPTPAFHSRAHFFAAAAEAMRRILVEHARRKGRQKRGGDWQRVTLESLEASGGTSDVDVVAIDEALSSLSREHPEKARLVTLRYFAGLTLAEAAEVLGVSTATAERHWRYARAWLARHLREGQDS